MLKFFPAKEFGPRRSSIGKRLSGELFRSNGIKEEPVKGTEKKDRGMNKS
jgi:hypothetical protein